MVSREQQYLDSYENFLKELFKIENDFIEELFILEHPGPNTSSQYEKTNKYPYFIKRLDLYKKYHYPIFNMIQSFFDFADISSCLTAELYQIYLKYYDNLINHLISKKNNDYKHYSSLDNGGIKPKRPAFLKYCNDFLSYSNGSSKIVSQPYSIGPTYFMRDLGYIFEQLFFNDYNIDDINHYQIRHSNQKSITWGQSIFYRFNFLINKLEDLVDLKFFDLKSEKTIVVETNPFMLSLLNNYDKFLSFCKENKVIIGITDYDCAEFNFSNLNDLIVNKMRSWKEGALFHTCKYGNKHWLENFFYCTSDHKIIDLFNIFNNYSYVSENPDEIWPLENTFKKCECGKFYREMNFNPCALRSFKNHLGKSVDSLGLKITSFKDSYEYFQIIQESSGDLFTIRCPNENIIACDFVKIVDFIKNKYGNNNFRIQIKNEPYIVGIRNKRPIFWSLK